MRVRPPDRGQILLEGSLMGLLFLFNRTERFMESQKWFDLLKWQQTRSRSAFHSQSLTLRRLTGVILVGKPLVRGLKSFDEETF